MKNIKGKRKNHLLARVALLVVLAAFLFFMAFQDFLHSHPLDSGEHEDCPIFMFKRAVHVSHLLWFAIFFILLVVTGQPGLTGALPKGRVPLTTISGRAPPFSSNL